MRGTKRENICLKVTLREWLKQQRPGLTKSQFLQTEFPLVVVLKIGLDLPKSVGGQLILQFVQSSVHLDKVVKKDISGKIICNQA
jgi:hypothetical protein